MPEEIKTNVCEFCGMRFSEANPNMGNHRDYHKGCYSPICYLRIGPYQHIQIVHHPEDKETPYYAERFENGELRDIIATNTAKETYRHARSIVRGARRYKTVIADMIDALGM